MKVYIEAYDCGGDIIMNVPERFAGFEDAVGFHGHVCPGLAVGYKVATTAMRLLGVDRPCDEELVAIVENDSCAVDAIQVVTGCTFGKGNLIFRDYGKGAFSFLSREKGKGYRIRYRKFPSLSGADQARMDVLREKVRSEYSVSDEERCEYDGLKEKLIRTILDCRPEDCLEWRSLTDEPPHPARIRPSVICQSCGEEVMETRILEKDGKKLCIPCSGGTNTHPSVQADSRRENFW